jgi:hypothetical protein
MVQAARAGVLAVLLSLAPPAFATALTNLQQAARRCFESPSAARCDGVWDLSDQLKKQADRSNQLRCYTALLALEANVAKARLGRADPVHQDQALQDTSAYCP